MYISKHKDDAFNAIKIFRTEIENKLCRSIEVIRSDRDGEYFSTEYDAYCEEYGTIIHECFTLHTPQQNGLV